MRELDILRVSALLHDISKIKCRVHGVCFEGAIDLYRHRDEGGHECHREPSKWTDNPRMSESQSIGWRRP